jgi:hypothetical protein
MMADLIGIGVQIVELRCDALQCFIEFATKANGAMASDEIVHAAQIEFGFADYSYVFVVCEASISEDVCGS